MLWSDFSHSAFKPSRELVVNTAWMHEQKIARPLPGASLRQENLKQENISLSAAHGSFTYNRQDTTHTHKLLISQASISHKSEQTAYTHTHTHTHNHARQHVEIDFNYVRRSVPGLFKIWFKLCILSLWGRSSDWFQGPTSCLLSSEWWDKSHKSSLWEWPLAGWAGWFLM